MACEYCTDPEGVSCFPEYGIGPHSHEWGENGIVLGSTVVLPREEWPYNFMEDPDCPGLGVYWCPHCGDGKPEEAK